MQFGLWRAAAFVSSPIHLFYIEAKQVLWSQRVCLCVRVSARYNSWTQRVNKCRSKLVGMIKAWPSRSGYFLVLIGFRMCIQDHFSTFLTITRRGILRLFLAFVVQSLDFHKTCWDNWHRSAKGQIHYIWTLFRIWINWTFAGSIC